MIMPDEPVYDSQQITFRSPPRRARWLKQLVGASIEQEFLNQKWIASALKHTPCHYRASLARWILAQSPHYFIYQWSDLYAPSTPRTDIIRMESDRNAASRAEICTNLLRPFLSSDATVVDFGCGPGYLAREVSQHVQHVIALDVAAGVIACAKALNPAPNLTYDVNHRDSLAAVPTASIDLVYSIAVFQHLPKSRALPFLREFKRILKPSGLALIHTILTQPNRQEWHPDTLPWHQQRTALRLVLYDETEWLETAAQAGFNHCAVHRIGEMATLNDDIGNEHLLVLEASYTS